MSSRNATNYPITDRLAYAIEEVSQATGLSASFLRLEITRGNLKATRAGRRVLITSVELQRYLHPERPIAISGFSR